MNIQGLLPSLLFLVQAHAVAAQDQAIEEIVVVEQRSITGQLGLSGSGSLIDRSTVASVQANHVNETLVRVPGAWISRGSGQEHLTAIRSAVLTGAGACGEFLFLEDGIPIRPAGFCNVNNLFELNSEQAQGIEVWRGPASAVLGGNALRGAINVITPMPERNNVAIEGGVYDFYRLSAQWMRQREDHQIGVSVNGVHSNGYRDDTGYGQQKLSAVQRFGVGDWQVTNIVNASNLNQETGGFVGGFEAFDDSDLRDSNPNPEAYRDAWSLRAASHWQRGGFTVVPYVRASDMEFLQHFLPGQPLEQNDQVSAGVKTAYGWQTDRLTMKVGGHVEGMKGALREFQQEPTTGSAFLVETRPAGLHYDYEVGGRMVAVNYDLTWQVNDGLRVLHSARVEHLRYDYDNKHLTGNTRDDGSTCGFGGCLYTRPADQNDDFTNAAGRLGLERDIGDLVAYAVVGTGFRPPQITEVYRLQRGQLIADLNSERLTSLEVGVKADQWSVAAFAQRTRDFIFRDAAGFNVSDGRTQALGIEVGYSVRFKRHNFDFVGSYAEHRYDFDRDVALGEQIRDGNLIDTAPRLLGSARWWIALAEELDSEFEVVVVGPHYVNAANSARYDGHGVVNWRATWRLNGSLTMTARILNLLDERYADRADFAFGGFRYFPGMPRQFYLGVRLGL